MAGPDRTREQVIENLRTAWHVQNERRKAQWDAQVLADQERPNGPGLDAPDPAQDDQGQTQRKLGRSSKSALSLPRPPSATR
jgi:hypothetical protein